MDDNFKGEVRRIDMEPGDVLPLLQYAGAIPDQAWGDYYCEGMAVARLAPDGVHVACCNPTHGSHPRYQVAAEAIARAMERVSARPGVCPDCDGGWLPVDSLQAQRQIVVAEVAGLFRGINLPERVV